MATMGEHIEYKEGRSPALAGGNRHNGGRGFAVTPDPTRASGGRAVPPPMPSNEGSHKGSSRMSVDDFVREVMTTDIPEIGGITFTSPNAVLAAIWATIWSLFLPLVEKFCLLLEVGRQTSVSSYARPIVDRVMMHNKNQLERLAHVDPFGNFCLTLVKAAARARAWATKPQALKLDDYKEFLATCVKGGIITTTATNTEGSWDSGLGIRYMLSPELVFIPGANADVIIAAFAELGEYGQVVFEEDAAYQEKEQREAQKAAPTERVVRLDLDTTTNKPVILKYRDIVSGEMTGVTTPVTLKGGLVRIVAVREEKKFISFHPELMPGHPLIDDAPLASALRRRIAADALRKFVKGDDPNLGWVTRKGMPIEEFQESLRWLSEVLHCLKKQEKAGKKSVVPATVEVAGQEAPPVVENVGTEPAPETIVTEEQMIPVGRVPLGDPDAPPPAETPAVVQ